MPNNKDMKLMIVTPNFNGGGAQRIAVNLANYYSSIGVDVSLLVFNSNGPYKNQVAKEVKLIDIQAPRVRHGFFKVRKAIKEQAPTHILSVIRDGNILLGLALLFNRESILIYREANTLDELKRKNFFKRFISLIKMKLGYLRADLIIANSKDTRLDLFANKIKKPDRIVVISNPVLPLNFTFLKSQAVAYEWVDSKYKIILNIGRFHKQKNQLILIEAFREVVDKVPEARLLLIGEGELECELKNKIKELSLNNSAQILPFQQNPWPFYQAASVFALTSEWEGFGNVIVEALACGTPVVSTDCPGGPRFILDDGRYGLLVKPNDKEQLANALIDVLKQTTVFKETDLIGRAMEFSVQKIGGDYMEAIKNA